MPYQCESGDGQPPVVVVQMLTGDVETVAWCEGCWPAFVATTFGHLFGLDDPIGLVVTAHGDPIAPEGDDQDENDDPPGPAQPDGAAAAAQPDSGPGDDSGGGSDDRPGRPVEAPEGPHVAAGSRIPY